MAGFSGIMLIGALVVVSGAIAYIGDIVGRRMGRKRLSLFGLRPRHTAIAVSVVAGMCITVVTLAVAMAVSENVREGFLRVDELRRRQARLVQEIETLNERAAALEQARQAAEDVLQERQRELDEAKAQLAQVSEQLVVEQEALARASAERERAEAQLRNAAEAFQRLSQREEQLRRQIQGLRAQVASGILERTTPVLLTAQQPLGVELIEGGRPKAEVVSRLEAFVQRLDAVARAAGARPLPGDDAAVVVRKPVRDPGTDAVTWATTAQVLDAVAERIRTSPGPVIVQAFSVLNTHAGEPVHVDFELFRNQLVFRRGETIAVTIVDGRLSEPAVMAALVGLLRDEVGTVARQRNIMPRVALGESGVFGSPRAAVGEMRFEELFAVMEEVRRAAAPVRVRALAAADTWTIGPLEVRLEVERLPVGSPR